MSPVRVLYFFPLNPVEKNSGSSARALGILEYFRKRQFHVDFVSKMDWGKWTPASMQLFKEAQVANQLHVFRRKPIKKNPVRYFFSYKARHVFYDRALPSYKGSIPNHATLYLQQQFNRLLKENEYDFVIISYAYWADLIRNNALTKSVTTIIDTHDLLAIQHQNDLNFNATRARADELRRVGLFNQIWAISPEETEYFSRFYGDRVKYVPPTMEDPQIASPPLEKEFDLIYVATNNPHNLASSRWFFDHVFPLLPNGTSLCIIGTIVSHIPDNLRGVTKLLFVEDLNVYYQKSRIAICPMLSGTGVKIKVLEALSQGLPVVCNSHGQDGLPEKTNNGCQVSDEAVEFAGFIKSLLTDSSLYNQQATRGRQFFRQHFAKELVYEKMDRLFSL